MERQKKRILIVEDDLTYGTMMQTWLGKKGYDVERVTRVSDAVKALIGSKFNLVLSDMRLPDRDGMHLLEWMQRSAIGTPFIMMTSYAEVQNAVEAMKHGACDYIAKPCQPDILLTKINDAIGDNDTSQTSTANDVEKTAGSDWIEGRSEVSRQLYDYVALVAPTPMSVLILGASGTGKEYVARRIHELSRRNDKPFLAIDCGAIPRDVAASEFFGHVRGAFTGADADKKGAFETANGGTLFLDEVGNLSYDIQVQLLRALQERKIRPVGAMREIDIDIRLVCATNGNLQHLVSEGVFREDLYHRINEFTIHMPRLAERGTDIYLFANLFLNQANAQLDRNVTGFNAKAMEAMSRYDWPGNLRELKNVVRRATLMAKGNYITDTDLTLMPNPQTPSHKTVVPQQSAAPSTLHDADEERRRIAEALAATGGNKSRAAQLLGIDRKTIYNKIARYGL